MFGNIDSTVKEMILVCKFVVLYLWQKTLYEEEIFVYFRLEITQSFMLSEVTRLKDIIKTNVSSSNIQAALGSFFEKLGDFDSAKHHLEKAVLLNSDNPGFFEIYSSSEQLWSVLYTVF